MKANKIKQVFFNCKSKDQCVHVMVIVEKVLKA